MGEIFGCVFLWALLIFIIVGQISLDIFQKVCYNSLTNKKGDKKMLDENFVNLCSETSAMRHRIRENTETICDYLNEIFETLLDFVLDGDNDNIRINGFYVDDFGRLRYETKCN